MSSTISKKLNQQVSRKSHKTFIQLQAYAMTQKFQLFFFLELLRTQLSTIYQKI
jgi:hypothetical protein